MAGSEETIFITVKEYKKLKKSYEILEHLYAIGVDNWDGFSLPDDLEDDE